MCIRDSNNNDLRDDNDNNNNKGKYFLSDSYKSSRDIVLQPLTLRLEQGEGEAKRVNVRKMTALPHSLLESGSGSGGVKRCLYLVTSLSCIMSAVEAGLFHQLLTTLSDLYRIGIGSESQLQSESESEWGRESVEEIRLLRKCLLMCWTGFSKLSSLQASRHVSFQLYSRMRDGLSRLRASGKPLLCLERLVGECEVWMMAQHPCVFPSHVILDHPFGALEMVFNAERVSKIMLTY